MCSPLWAWRREHLLSLDDLAAAAGVSNNWIVQIEHGRQTPRYKTMRAICAALKVQPRWTPTRGTTRARQRSGACGRSAPGVSRSMPTTVE
jgi:transcriptional regulator with XRE-family HTH domain